MAIVTAAENRFVTTALSILQLVLKEVHVKRITYQEFSLSIGSPPSRAREIIAFDESRHMERTL